MSLSPSEGRELVIQFLSREHSRNRKSKCRIMPDMPEDEQGGQCSHLRENHREGSCRGEIASRMATAPSELWYENCSHGGLGIRTC